MNLTDLIKHQSKTARILTLDIERLGGSTRGQWGPKQTYIPERLWTEKPRTICWSARWYNEPDTTIFGAEWEPGGWKRMISSAWELYNEADVVVGYNSVNFDNKHLKGGWVEAGLQRPAPWKDVDLFRVVRAEFGWEFKSLDSVTRRLGAPGKMLHYDVDTAYEAVQGNKEAQEILRTYNIGDIELTEWLYDRLRGWIPSHPNVSDTMDACNQCGGTNLSQHDTNYRAQRIEYELFRCRDCGGYTKGKWISRISNTSGVK